MAARAPGRVVVPRRWLAQEPPSKPDADGKSPEAAPSEQKDQPYVNPETGEIGGPRGPEPTRYGDWEKGGRCYDF